MLRLMPDGSREPIPGIDWQDSSIFEGMHTGGGYILQVVDIKGRVVEKVIPIEDPLEIIAYGGYIYSGNIYITMATNILSNMHLSWGIPDSEGNVEQEDLGWNTEFSFGHEKNLPRFYMDAEHHYWISARSQFGQTVTVNGRYVITPSDVIVDATIIPIGLNSAILNPELFRMAVDTSYAVPNSKENNSITENPSIPELQVTTHDDINKTNREIKGAYAAISYDIS
ncbi:MAG: hypothetical protein ACOCUK_02375 [bacterium]